MTVIISLADLNPFTSANSSAERPQRLEETPVSVAVADLIPSSCGSTESRSASLEVDGVSGQAARRMKRAILSSCCFRDEAGVASGPQDSFIPDQAFMDSLLAEIMKKGHPRDLDVRQ